jgi:hypothetical protein
MHAAIPAHQVRNSLVASSFDHPDWIFKAEAAMPKRSRHWSAKRADRLGEATVESVRVDISYRPLRIGWAIRKGDFDAFRSATRLSFVMWGGRFNPVIVVDEEEQARNLVDLFRLDMIVSIGDSDVVKSFPKRFPYLLNPFFPEGLFIGGVGSWHSHVLDVHNALVHLQTKPEWQAVKKNGLRIYSWAPDDPLSDVFLMQFGQYPNPDEIHIDYYDLLTRATDAARVEIDSASELPADLLDFPSIPFLSRFGLERHYSVPEGWDYPGFFSGDATNFDDLVCCWNLRAADIPLLFVDAKHLERYGGTIGFWDESMRGMVSRRSHEFERRVGVWVRAESVDQENIRESIAGILKPFGAKEFNLCSIRPDSFNGSSVRAPMMHFGQVSTLGVMGTDFGKPRISFALDNKPFSNDNWFHTQHLVASLSFIGGLYGDEQHMLVPPYLPELNEFYGRSQNLYDKIRSEPRRIGLVIDAIDPSSSIYAMSVADLFEKIFEMTGFKSKLSAGGLIARQLIAQLGGVDGARAFKIPGVRRLLRTYGPTDTFTKNGALQLIGGKDPENPGAKFSDHENLYIEPRPHGIKLTPEAVFTYLVGRGLFRIGVELKCSHCRMDSWTALDVLKQKLVCELCGHEFDATRQLIASTWHYRRSGLLGAERNAQGAVPVLLTLQQFDANLKGLWHDAAYSPSLDLESEALGDSPKFEIDFAWLIPRSYPDRVVVLLGECKDRGGKKDGGQDTGTIDKKDIDNLRRVADALPRKRFDAFIVLAKLCPFTADEIALAKTLNDEYTRRVILLTSRELEPLHFYERTKLEYKDINEYGSTAQGMADNTAEMYFK